MTCLRLYRESVAELGFKLRSVWLRCLCISPSLCQMAANKRRPGIRTLAPLWMPHACSTGPGCSLHNFALLDKQLSQGQCGGSLHLCLETLVRPGLAMSQRLVRYQNRLLSLSKTPFLDHKMGTLTFMPPALVGYGRDLTTLCS